jgi:hypothetical protein
MTKLEVVGVSRGRSVTQADIDELANQAERGYDAAQVVRRGGRRTMGSGPAEVLPVRLSPELRAAVEARASLTHATVSEVVREALRSFLDVA